MKYRLLGSTGVQISELGFGTMSFGQDADEGQSKVLFHRCREVGINLFDCADMYGKGRAETILGQLIKDCRNEVVITSKGYFPTSDDVNARGNSRYHLVQAVEASLRRLDTDRIDIYFMHRFDDAADVEQSLRTLDDLVHQGKILYVGLSNFAAWQASKTLGVSQRWGLAPPVCVQPMYNLVKRQAEVEILPMARAEGIAVLPYSPLGAGLLAGKYGTTTRPASGRLVENKMYKTRYGSEEYYEVAERFSKFAWDNGHHPASLAVAWVAAHAAVTAPLIGARRIEQLEVLLKATEIDVTRDLYETISAMSTKPSPATDRNEELSGMSPTER